MVKFVILLISLIGVFSTHAQSAPFNGFDLSNSEVSREKISHGGPPRDAIPAIDSPNFRLAQPSDKNNQGRILGVDIYGVQRAYPISILNWHEIVNDTLNGHPVMITYCPLCGSGIAFESESAGFGVSGLLFNSDVLLYDRKTESLWSQIGMRAISGERKGEHLKSIALVHTTLSQWLKMFPTSEILSSNTGFKRDYSRSPYAGYEKSPHTYFDVSNKAPDIFHPKSLVLGVRVGNQFKAYPYERLSKLGQKHIRDQINGKYITINWDAQAQSAHIDTSHSHYSAHGTQMFWFAWYAFYPDTLIFEDEP